MSNSIEKQLTDLEEISYRISDLISENKYIEILDLDKKRNQIIEKIYKNHGNKNLSGKIYNLIINNEVNIKKTEQKMAQLQKNKNKFFKRLKAYQN